MKIRTSDLTGVALSWAVAACEGEAVEFIDDGITRCLLRAYSPVRFAPSTNWAQGGPIIEREGIELLCESLGFRWVAMPQKGPEWRGSSPLIAAMRCYVASKLGEEIEVPAVLLDTNPDVM